MEQTSIRRAYAADTPTIAHIVNESWRAAYAGIVPQAFLDALSDEKKTAQLCAGLERVPDMRYYLFESDGEPVGAASLHVTHDDDLTNTAEFTFFYFLPFAWRRGYGGLLLDHMKREARDMGFERLCCWVLGANLRAVSFYESQGMRRDGKRQTVTVGEPLEAVRCQTDL